MIWTGEAAEPGHTRKQLYQVLAYTYMAFGLLIAIAGGIVMTGQSLTARHIAGLMGAPVRETAVIYGLMIVIGGGVLFFAAGRAWRRRQIVSPTLYRTTTFALLLHIVLTAIYAAGGSIGGWLAVSIYTIAYIAVSVVGLLGQLTDRLMR